MDSTLKAASIFNSDTLQKFLKISAGLNTVLLAAPDKHTFTFCMKMFKAHGVEVHLAFDGRSCFSDALKAKQAGRPYDLIILATDLPVLDGFSTALLLKDNQCAANIVSVSEDNVYWHEAVSDNTGCDLHLEQKDLDNCVATWLQVA